MTLPPPIELPAGLQAQLAAHRRRLWRVETLAAVLGAVSGLLAVYVLLLVLDRFWDTPGWVRLILLVGGVTACAAAAVYWLRRWGWQSRDARALAVLVQRQYPRLGDRLLGVVELAEQARQAAAGPDDAASRRGTARVSAALCRAAMDQVARETAGLDFARAAPGRPTRWWSLTAAVLAVLVVGAGLLWPGAARNAILRLIRPLGGVARYTMVRLQGVPHDRVVPHGEPFTVEARLDPASRWAPAAARGRVGHQPPVVSPLTDGAYRFELAGQTEPGTLQIAAGDARERTRLAPLVRPGLVTLTAQVIPPVYLGYDPVVRDAAGGTLRVLPGSRVGLTATVSRPLARATLDEEPLAVADAVASLSPRKVDAAGRWALAWEDRFGLTARSPFVLAVALEEDAPPAVQFRGAAGVVAILEDELFTCDAVAEDDYGVQQLDLAWEALGNESAGVSPARGRMPLASGGQRVQEVTGTVRFLPQALGIKPQRVILRAQATDYCPDRLAVASAPIELLVLDRLEHAELVQRELERLQEQFEELLRAEENLFAANRDLRENLDDPEAGERLREQQQGEEANRRELERLLEDAAALLKEALRNKLIAEATLERWAELLRKLQPLAQSEMAAVAQALRQAQQQQGAQRQESVDQALARQEEVLKKMLEALQDMTETGDQLLAENFVNRLRQAAQAQHQLGVDLVRLVPDTIGLRPDSLSALNRGRLTLLETRQGRTQRVVRDIRDDLGHFHERTGGAAYQAVHKDMTDERVAEALGELAARIGENRTAQSVDGAQQWSAALAAWADQLAAANQRGGGGGGGGGGGSSSARVLEQLLRLLRVRQAEEGLREQTRFLEQSKPAAELYAASADRLRQLQDSLVTVVVEVGEALPDPALLELLGRVEAAMHDASDLLAKPQTDGATIAAETEVIELLSQSADQAAACQSGGQGAGGGANAASVLAMLRQMLGMGAGQAGTGSNRGGTTDQPSNNPPDDATGPGAGSRPVEKAIGRDRSTWPAEYREALDAYLNAVEEGR